ncbi:MAG: YdbL family protein [Desulfobacterium sp.]|nr:YdbL family protein [Desulfobacterium sp.]
MNIKRMAVLGIALMVASVFVAQGAFANNIKQRMKQRLPVIVTMKSQGIVGENANGYLAFVTARRAHEDVVASENKDRKTVYSAIAAQQGVGIATVEKRRALQIANRAKKGEFLKNESGVWYKK